MNQFRFCQTVPAGETKALRVWFVMQMNHRHSINSALYDLYWTLQPLMIIYGWALIGKCLGMLGGPFVDSSMVCGLFGLYLALTSRPYEDRARWVVQNTGPVESMLLLKRKKMLDMGIIEPVFDGVQPGWRITTSLIGLRSEYKQVFRDEMVIGRVYIDPDSKQVVAVEPVTGLLFFC